MNVGFLSSHPGLYRPDPWIQSRLHSRSVRVARVSLPLRKFCWIACASGASSSDSRDEDYEKLAKLFGPQRVSKNKRPAKPLPASKENKTRPTSKEAGKGQDVRHGSKNMPGPNSSNRVKPSPKDNEDAYKELKQLLGPRDSVENVRENRSMPAPADDIQGKMQKKTPDVEKTKPKTKDNECAYKELEQLLGPRDSVKQQRRNRSKLTPKNDTEDKMEKKPPVAEKRVLTAEEEREAAKNRARMYEEMEQLLGPPKERFQRKRPSSSQSRSVSKDAPSDESNRKGADSANYSASASGESNNEKDSAEPKMKEARTFEQEYAVLESLLRANKPSNMPRSGRRPDDSLLAKYDGIMMEPWRTRYNLTPKKGLREEKKRVQTMESRHFVPDEVVISPETIEQSYWVLEKILRDEEEEWEEGQEKLAKAAKEKRLARKARREEVRAKWLAENSVTDDNSSTLKTPSKSTKLVPAVNVSSAPVEGETTSEAEESSSDVVNKKYPPHLMMGGRQDDRGVFCVEVIESRPPNFLEGVDGKGWPDYQPVTGLSDEESSSDPNMGFEESEWSEETKPRQVRKPRQAPGRALLLLLKPKLLVSYD